MCKERLQNVLNKIVLTFALSAQSSHNLTVLFLLFYLWYPGKITKCGSDYKKLTTSILCTSISFVPRYLGSRVFFCTKKARFTDGVTLPSQVLPDWLIDSQWCPPYCSNCPGGADLEGAELPALPGGEVSPHQREHQPARTLVSGKNIFSFFYLLPGNFYALFVWFSMF